MYIQVIYSELCHKFGLKVNDPLTALQMFVTVNVVLCSIKGIRNTVSLPFSMNVDPSGVNGIWFEAQLMGQTAVSSNGLRSRTAQYTLVLYKALSKSHFGQESIGCDNFTDG